MPMNPVRILGSFPESVRVLVYGTFINRLGGIITTFLALILKREFLLSESKVGLVLLSFGVGTVGSTLVGGYLADRLGRRRTLLISLYVSGTLAIAMGLATSVTALIPLLFLFGFFTDIHRPASSAMLADLMEPERLTVGYAAFRTAINLGFMFGLVIGASLAEWNWRWVFWFDGLTTLLFAILAWKRLPETLKPRAAAAGSVIRGAFPWGDKVFRDFWLVSLISGIVYLSHTSVLPLYITERYPVTAVGWLLAINGFLIVLLEMGIVNRLQHLEKMKVVRWGLGFTTAGFLLTGFSNHWCWLAFTIVLWTLGEILISPFLLSAVMERASAESKGLYSSWFIASWSLGNIISPPLLLSIHEKVPDFYFWPFLACTLIYPLASVGRIIRRSHRIPAAAVQS